MPSRIDNAWAIKPSIPSRTSRKKKSELVAMRLTLKAYLISVVYGAYSLNSLLIMIFTWRFLLVSPLLAQAKLFVFILMFLFSFHSGNHWPTLPIFRNQTKSFTRKGSRVSPSTGSSNSSQSLKPPKWRAANDKRWTCCSFACLR